MKFFFTYFILFSVQTFCLALEQENDIIQQFQNFIKTFNKEYLHDEYIYRFNIFSKNNEIVKTNNIYNTNYKLKMNQFSDLSISEFEKEYLLLQSNKNNFEMMSYETKDLNCDVNDELTNLSYQTPKEFDWQQKNKVTEVKNQENCGSCWAFSTVAAIESENAIVNNKLVDLSPQELVDCATGEYKNKGCEGGLMESGFHFVMDNGVCTEKSYPYKGVDEKCMKCSSALKLSDCKSVPAYNETALKYALLEKPISVAVDAGTPAFQFYSEGIVDSACGTNLNHAVLLVGYGEEKGKKFWRIKNSWGKTWGEDGYIRIARQDSNQKSSGMCGITKMASYPILQL